MSNCAEMLRMLPTLQVWVGAVGGVVGTALGFFNFLDARRKEREKKRTEDADWQRWVGFLADQAASAATIAFQPESGSENHRWAERMVARGMLRRESHGRFYTISSED